MLAKNKKRSGEMANIWHDISPERIKPEDFIAVIEISKGSKKKYAKGTIYPSIRE